MISKFFKYSFSYLLIYVFVFSFPFSLSLPQVGEAYAGSSDSQAGNCSGSQVWHEELKRCLKREQFIMADRAARQCLTKGNKDEISTCLRVVQQELNSDKRKFQEKYNPSETNMLAHTLAMAAPGILPVAWYAKQLAGKKKTNWLNKTSLSIHGITAATAMVVLGELQANKVYLESVRNRATQAATLGLRLKPQYQKEGNSSPTNENGEIDYSRYEEVDYSSNDQGYELQQKITQYMIDTEKDMQAMFDLKTKAYGTAATIYSAAAALAAFEAAGNGLTEFPEGSGCKTKDFSMEPFKQNRADERNQVGKQLLNVPSKPTDPYSDKYQENFYMNPGEQFIDKINGKKLFNLTVKNLHSVYQIMFPQAYAGDRDPIQSGQTTNFAVQGAVAGASIFVILKSVFKKTPNGPGCLMEMPLTRIAIASAGASMAWMFTAKFAKEKQLSIDRAKVYQIKLDSLRNSGCSREDRNMNTAGNENCFCLNEDNTWNAARMANPLCQAYNGQQTALATTNYNNPNGNQRLGCIDSQSRWDPKCKCKGVNGRSNTCMKMKKMGGFPGLTNTAWYNQLGAGANAALSDNFGGGNSNFNSAGKKAIRAAKAVTDKLIKKGGPKEAAKAKKFKKLHDSYINRAKQQLQRAFPGGAPQSTVSQAMAKSKSLQNSKDPKDILKSAREQLKITKHGIGELPQPKPQNNSGDGWDFNSGSGSNNGGLSQGKFDQDQVNKVMGENYSLNEINENSHQNIFQVITHRYHQSGLRALFKEEEAE